MALEIMQVGLNALIPRHSTSSASGGAAHAVGGTVPAVDSNRGRSRSRRRGDRHRRHRSRSRGHRRSTRTPPREVVPPAPQPTVQPPMYKGKYWQGQVLPKPATTLGGMTVAMALEALYTVNTARYSIWK